VIVDSHHHFWNPDRGDYPWMTGPLAPIRRRFGPEDLAPGLRECGVDRSIVVQTWSSLGETRELLRIAAATDFVAGVVGWVDLSDPGVGQTIQALKSSPAGRYLVGVRHQVHDEPDPKWLLRPDVDRGISAAGRAGLVYDLLVRPRELPAALDLVRRHPETTFVIDHIAKPAIARHEISPWSELIASFGRLPNVNCTLSGMVTEADWATWRPDDLKPYAGRVVDCFGPKRVMFGSDWPVCLVAASYRQVFDATLECIAGLSAEAQGQVMGESAIAVYRLAGAA